MSPGSTGVGPASRDAAASPSGEPRIDTHVLDLAGPQQQAAERLLSLEEGEALDAALAAVEPHTAAYAVAIAPGLEKKTALLWSLEDRPRRRVLEFLPPALVAALVQNLEDDNRYLLGDLSVEQFRALLQLCSPERKYYWIRTALSFTDVRANALPLLLPTSELVEILDTRSEFEAHCRTLAEYPLEEQRVPPDLMLDPAQALVDLFGAEGLLTQFPVADPDLAGVLQTILDFDADRYADLIRAEVSTANYRENHPGEWEAVAEEPLLLQRLDPIEIIRDDLEIEDTVPSEGAVPPLALIPLARASLARVAGNLPVARRRQVDAELQELCVRQAIAEGGSFLLEDLERISQRVQAYLLLGLAAESGGRKEREPAVLFHRPLHRVEGSGAVVVERLRQAALRLSPLEAYLAAEQRAVVRSLLAPRLGLDSVGAPQILLLPAPGLPDAAPLDAVAHRLNEAVAWTGLLRELGLEAAKTAITRLGSPEQLQEEVALAVLLFGRPDFHLTDPRDRQRLRQQHCTREGELTAEARTRLRRGLAAETGGSDREQAALGDLLERSLERLAARC